MNAMTMICMTELSFDLIPDKIHTAMIISENPMRTVKNLEWSWLRILETISS
jgi:hypothetical protein